MTRIVIYEHFYAARAGRWPATQATVTGRLAAVLLVP